MFQNREEKKLNFYTLGLVASLKTRQVHPKGGIKPSLSEKSLKKRQSHSAKGRERSSGSTTTSVTDNEESVDINSPNSSSLNGDTGSNNNAWKKLKSRTSFLNPTFRNRNAKNDEEDFEENFDVFQASRNGHLSALKFHLDKNSKMLNELNGDKLSPLHIAAMHNRVKIIEELIGRGCDINIKSEEKEGISPLHVAAKRNCTDALQLLVNSVGVDLNAKTNKGLTALHCSARKGHAKSTEILLKGKGADSNVRDSDQMTPLHQATLEGNVAVCALLVENQADISAKEVNGITPFMLASAGGFKSIIELFIDTAKGKGPEFLKACLSDADNEGNNSLHLASSGGHVETVRLLLAEGADVNARKQNQFTPLHIASIHGFVEIAEVLIERQANISAKDEEQMTPLHKAAMYNQVDVMDLLIRKGAIINARDADGFTPLLSSAWKGRKEAAAHLLDNGADLLSVDNDNKSCLHWAVAGNHFDYLQLFMETQRGGMALLEMKDLSDQTPLLYAAEGGKIRILNLLITNGADIFSKDIDERSALHLASQSGQFLCAESLLKISTVNINEDDIDGRTPLLLACFEGHLKVVKVLLRHGAEISSRDDEEWSALALAASNGHVQIMDTLIENNAEITTTDKSKNTPLHVCSANGHTEAVKLLLNNQASVTAQNCLKKNPLEMAIENHCEEVAKVFVEHKDWEDSLSSRGADSHTPLKRLIERMPSIACLVLDQCIIKRVPGKDSQKYRTEYDYHFIDPGPDDEVAVQFEKRYYALKTMVNCGREQLLSHELSQTLLDRKWKSYGRFFFYFNLLIYFLLLAAMTFYGAFLTPITTDQNLDASGCVYFNSTDGQITYPELSESAQVTQLMVVIITMFNTIRELCDIFRRRFVYLTEAANYLNWAVYTLALLFVLPPLAVPCTRNWIFGALGIFLGWINFILYLKSFDSFDVGLYVIMFEEVISSILKAMMVYVFFIIAFASAFYILLSGEAPFSSFELSLVKVFVMMTGEFDFNDLFFGSETFEIPYNFLLVSYFIFVVFLFVMPIVLINLLIGISVGDIESVRKDAYLKRLSIQVNYVVDLERRLPIYLQRRWWIPKATVYPHENSKFKKLKMYFFGTNDTQFICKGETNKQEEQLDGLYKRIDTMEIRQKNMYAIMEQQSELVIKISEKLQVKTDADILDAL